MKQLLIIISIITLIACKKEQITIVETPINNLIDTNQPTTKVGFVIDSVWFNNKFNGYKIETQNGRGEGDFNKDGRKDLVIMFASNSEAKYGYQKDTSSRIVVGVFLNHKTYFELDTNLVYSYLGGYSDISVADINNDGFLDIYQMTGYWEGVQHTKPTYYNNNGHGGMDSYVYLNNQNKSLKKYTIPIKSEDGGSTTSIIFDNNKNGFSEIYLASCKCYYEFDGISFNRNNLSIDNNLGIITPKYADSKSGVTYTAQSRVDDNIFILKVDNNKLISKLKFKPAYANSGPAQGIYVNDLDKDGKFEYIVPMEISSNSDNTKPAVPYLMIVDENGNDVSTKYMDIELTKPLTYEQIDWVGETWQTGFIYHTFADLDNDGIMEIFPASGIGYKKDNQTYYYKFINGKYRLQLYHSNWIGNVHKSKGYTNYKAFVDEKNRVNLFLVIEFDLHKSIFKTF